MSTRDDNPFARWSRRKQAARKAEASPPEEEKHTGAEKEERGESPEPAAELDAAETAEPLPRLEDITAESDLTAFLRKGVPAALRNTALRKMWSLDPVIRDYVGPAEYAWDFNKPGSMAGFGPLEAGKSVANFLSKVGRSDPQDTLAEPPEERIASSDHDVAASPDRPTETSEPAEPAQPVEQPEAPQSDLSQSQATPDEAADKPTPAEPPRTLAQSRHGGALPR
ncbi:DUF3306 domain-containing protein [Chelativorans salis]|uniref:DUF3306 domain-containing protein n=1 Tax=Chelativorans salis TaxID=2978478 RepID=A0ABT2LRK7_9HYPH|nr:DUF3306 domain-containing protein [Chelativorans sp. EGI FJ00035]MCT7377181.1 DUF3306 domain-containing protein [Chelativorans sp. EGI FJ00035]